MWQVADLLRGDDKPAECRGTFAEAVQKIISPEMMFMPNDAPGPPAR